MRFYTSDLHFGHANMLEYENRPFDSVDAMNAGIIERWNEQVDPLDDVLVLGDFAMGHIADTLPLAGQLNGFKFLVCGNHDRPWAGNGHNPDRQAEWRRMYEQAGFTYVANVGRFNDCMWRVGDQLVRASHFPFETDEWHGDRFVEWHPKDESGTDWLLHGHVHSAWLQRGRQINVGIDAWGGELVTEDTLRALMAGGPVDRKALPWT